MTFAGTPRISSIILIVLMCGCPGKDVEQPKHPELLLVVDVHFALDGGSVLFRLSEPSDGKEHFVLSVCPESPLNDKFFPKVEPQSAVLIACSDPSHPENGKLMTEVEVDQLLDKLTAGKSKDEMALRTRSVVEYLERISIYNEKPTSWGHAAVQTIVEKGRGADCFGQMDSVLEP
ncbi:hypothetical protein Q31a_13890 [Aureliella helgolandensis]|uniref:Uncharacterized protein n=2 Tax=Aureliella helgolandensis TaxID=2527968 RepID=A0A518G3C9_9BACT|nr:hypothetical protein Q31a_13890 [Aureliella helgolandensis]